MKSFIKILLLIISNLFFSQNNFKINLSAPEFEKDSLFIGASSSSGNTHKIYKYVVSTNSETKFDKDFNSTIVKIQSKNIVEGKILYPQPLSVSYYDPKINRGFETKPFFLENANFNIEVNKTNNLSLILNSESPSNKEYKILNEKLKIFDDRLKPFQDNDPKDIDAKQQFLQNYIKMNPNSFVAFWEIVSDFSKFGFNKYYVKNLSFFSNNIKKTFSFIEFKKIIDIENSTNVGGNFPNIIFENNEKITKSEFSKYNLTLIDYWSTTCKPCIDDLPKLVNLYEIYKDKNINFISVTDENQKARIDLANSILKKNKVTWKNYFDLKKEFPKKLNAAGYPLQILVDRNGKIVARKIGELDQINDEIENHIE